MMLTDFMTIFGPLKPQEPYGAQKLQIVLKSQDGTHIERYYSREGDALSEYARTVQNAKQAKIEMGKYWEPVTVTLFDVDDSIVQSTTI